jgi:CheY-like chemotaxis protein
MSRLLVIEDNETNRDLISRYLKLYDYEIVMGCDGAEGLELAMELRESIDLILLDMNLPKIDGWEVARRLKADPLTASLPILAMTAHAMVGDREIAMSSGCDDYVTKPLDFKLMFQKIEKFCAEATI